MEHDVADLASSVDPMESNGAAAAGSAAPNRVLIDLGDLGGAEGAEAATPDRVATLEGELADWQRRAVMWRERALSTQALNDALNNHLADLQAMLQLQATASAQSERGVVASVAREPVEQWWMRVFRRDTWTSPR